MKVEYNNINVPESISEKFLLKALESEYGNDIAVIKEINFTMGSSGGENYCSDIYRTNVIFTTKTDELEEISLIIKSMPNTSHAILAEMDIYNKEKIMYFDVLPSLEAISKGCKFSPKCFYAEAEPIPSIVFEDLKPLGYQMQDREIGMDKAHAKLVLKKVGKYHASTIKFVDQHPELLKFFKKGVLLTEGNRVEQQKWANENFAYLCNMLKDWPDYEQILVKLEKIQDKYIQKTENLMRNYTGKFKVLNHGDLWLNNMMFKNDSEQVSDVIFIDFQLGIYQSPGIDINYFLTTSVQLDVLKNYRDELIECYYNSLRTSLEEIGVSNTPSLNDIKNEIIATAFYSFFTGLTVLPAISMSRESSKDNTIETFQDENFIMEKRKIMFSSDRMHKTLKYLLKQFNEVGLLDKLINVKVEEE